VMVPLMVKTLDIEKTMAAEQSYAIDWNVPAVADAEALA
jgi:hypothetical protein